MDKAALFAALRDALSGLAADLGRGQAQTAEGLNVDGSHRPSNRGERGAVSSAGYLAHGLEARRTEVLAALDLLERTPATSRDRAVTGAVVTVASGAGTRTWLIFPGGSGLVLGDVVVVSPESPVGRALWGLEVGDGVQLPQLGEVELTALH